MRRERYDTNRMLHVALWEPEIPPNVGNIARLCAATATPLHLIGRIGFRLDDRHLRRAGLDYWPAVDVRVHAGWEDFEERAAPSRVICLTTRATRPYTRIDYRDGDALLFGSESNGLPPGILQRFAETAATIPMPGGAVRCLNLATSVGIVLYEALRQRHGW
jgi:tRNA (cytidine/uridine-2'-O-)-methyltransferase